MSLERFVGKVAVVTGASAGIGRELVKALVKQGVIVAGLARRSERIEEIANELKNEKGKLHAFKCDLTNDEEILATFKKITESLGPISILVNNAGLSPATELIDGDISKWRQIIDTNILALSICTREAIASMKANNIKGHIVHINSIAGHMPLDLVGFSVYPATKYAVTALTESLRREVNRNGLPIKVTSVSPGYVETDFFVSMYDSKDLPAYLERSGLKAKDVADTVVYVLSTPEHVNVAGISRRVERVQEHANQLKNGNGSLHPFKCDLTKDKEILDTFKKIIETLGPIHILVNNAGVAPATALIDGDIKRWRQIIDTNVIGLSICTREAIANMKANNTKGHIVHVNSVLGHEIGEFPYLSVYPGSKHAVTALTECLRREINRNNLPIKITSVSPGGVSTEFAEVNLGAEGVKRFENVPLLSADDVADTIVYVLSTPEHVNVAGLARRVERIEELAKQLKNDKGKLYGFKADMTKEDEIISAFKKITETLGPIHILINNAGVAPSTSLIDGDISKWRQILDTNVLALSIGTREAIASMKASNIKGHIININSVAGHDPMDIPGISVYPASKYAVTALTESFRKEINRNKLPIKITSISPGYVKSEMAEAAFGPEAAKGINSRPGLETEDIADNIVYVLSTPEHVNIKELTVVIQGQEA